MEDDVFDMLGGVRKRFSLKGDFVGAQVVDRVLFLLRKRSFLSDRAGLLLVLELKKRKYGADLEVGGGEYFRGCQDAVNDLKMMLASEGGVQNFVRESSGFMGVVEKRKWLRK